ncbi:transporter substrate-binding domain-containing protein [Nocardia sp. alder85J]|uniref:transporter substrate-binding domain-containing protein n=1 Tax=Nocardia sp. alder85J TaxID=2862949 RepID=UPI001CD659E6|nr:transporter substrate-binding domain-containing protein [Nocardia sp. alder85J]MCX4098181.1 transporter substrate-binding domain-containing protein [Nocardia sp. alder85J]
MNIRATALAVIVAVAGSAALLAGCGSSTSTSSSSTSSAAAAQIPDAKFRQDLHDALPAEIKSAGRLRLAAFQFPPYEYYKEDGKTPQGIYVQVADALKKVLGVDVDLNIEPSIADIATALGSGRDDASLSSLADLPTTEESFDFADWLKEYVAFMVKKGNPKHITGLDATCGTSIATLQGGPSEQVLKKKTTECVQQGRRPIDIKTFPDQNTAVLAVRSGRADAAFSQQVPLGYYVSQDSGFELAGTNQSNGFPDLYFGAYALKGKPVLNVLLGAFEALRTDGVYDALLKQYGLQANRIDQFGINLSTRNK